MTKKVIFVGGTMFSGTTFFHLTLANDPKGFSIGEVKSLLRPVTDTRSAMVCNCGDPTCDLWERVEKKGTNHLYETIFDLHPDVEYIVDSSKVVTWINSQTNRLAKAGIETKHVVIWKTLLEYAYSLHKRSRLQIENGKQLGYWPNYHRIFYSLIKEFATVRYNDYTRDNQRVLQAVCAYLGIPYFEGKERFWEKTHHALAGNFTAQLHLHEKGSLGYQDLAHRANVSDLDMVPSLGFATAHYRKIYYENPDEEIVGPSIAALRRKYPYLDEIEAMLNSRDVRYPEGWGAAWPDLQASTMELAARRALAFTKEEIARYRY